MGRRARWVACVLVATACAGDPPTLPGVTASSVSAGSDTTGGSDPEPRTSSVDDTAARTGTDDGPTTGPDPTTTTGDGTDTGAVLPPVGECVGVPTECTRPSAGSGACDVWAQDCPAGFKCVPQIGDPGETACVALAGVVAGLGEPCLADHGGPGPIDSCDVGLVCVGGNLRAPPVCTAFCGCGPQAPTCPEPGRVCARFDDGTWGLCQPPCNPLASDCPAGEGCFPIPDTFEFACSPSQSPGADPYDACDGPTDCAPGQRCVPGPSIGCLDANCCARICDLADPARTPCTKACVPWSDRPVPPACAADVGFCVED